MGLMNKLLPFTFVLAACQVFAGTTPVDDYRNTIYSTDGPAYSRAALAAREWFIEHDPYRPIYHFTAVEGRINDPNGPIYHNGKYHLFYQFAPLVPGVDNNLKWGGVSWGHAVSDDLVHWEDWPVALWPDSEYDSKACYSGNTFIHQNRIHALYTGNVRGRNETYGMLAWSEDGGVPFNKKWSRRPVRLVAGRRLAG